MIKRVLFETKKFKKQEKYALIIGIKFCTPNYTKFTQKIPANLKPEWKIIRKSHHHHPEKGH